MINPIFSESYLHNLTNPSTVLYLEQSPRLEMNAFVREKLEEIVERFWEVGVDFVYLPALFESEAYGEVVEYNHPYVGEDWKELPLSAVYEVIGARFGLEGSANGLLVVESDRVALRGLFVPFTSEKDLMDGVDAMVEKLEPRLEEILFYEANEPVSRDSLDDDWGIWLSVNMEAPTGYSSDVEMEVEELVRRLVERGLVEFQ